MKMFLHKGILRKAIVLILQYAKGQKLFKSDTEVILNNYRFAGFYYESIGLK